MFNPSIFGDLLKLIPRELVRDCVKQHGSDKWRKSFRTWDHLVAMLAAQFSCASSLRDLERTFEDHAHKLYHLNCTSIKRSTLADANMSRDHGVFAALADKMVQLGGRKARDAKAMMEVIDSTTIRLAGRGQEWAKEGRTRANGQGLKVHMALCADDGSLSFAKTSTLNVNDITMATDMSLHAGHIYLFDKGYYHYNWWHEIIETGAHFITRLKKDTAYKIIEERPLSPDDPDNVLSDRVICLTNKRPGGGRINKLAGHHLRLVEIEHPGGKDKGPFLIVSDMLDVSAGEIALGYKRRWLIELLFKWIKQNLKIKRFIGESRNAVLIQIYVAIIAYVVMGMYKRLLKDSFNGRLKDLLLTIKMGLFHPLNPIKTKPPDSCSRQMLLWDTAP